VDGRDSDFFDYTTVDGDVSLDHCAEAVADTEDAYFFGNAAVMGDGDDDL